MRVAVVLNAVAEGAAPDVEDVLVQAAAVEAALGRLGHQFLRISCSLNLAELKNRLVQERPEVIFNLAESLDGSERLQFLPTVVYEELEVPYTGAGSAALWCSSDKLLAKRRLREHGLRTPDWATLGGGQQCCFVFHPPSIDGPGGTGVSPVLRPEHGQDARGTRPSKIAAALGAPFIVKAVWEHGSVGLNDESVVRHAVDDVAALLAERSCRDHRTYFAEQYIDGREFNLAMLASAEGAEVLPPSEIEFVGYASGRPRIVGYNAKWEEHSPEYEGTPRRFEFSESDNRLLEELVRMARACWKAFEMRGYARVDFRVDDARRPWILEVNANPCLSPDGGFAATLRHAGISYDEAIQRLLDDAIRSVC